MMTYVSYAALFAISFFEVWLCYQLLFATVIDREKLGAGAKISIAISIIVIGSILAMNRRLLFFSHNALIIICILSCIWVGILHRKQICLLVELIVMFYTVVSLLDFCFAFLCMSFLKEKFIQLVYCNSISVWSIMIFLFTRLICGGIIVLFVKHIKSNIRIAEYQKILIPVCFVLCIILRFYQIILSKMAYEGLPIREWNIGVSLLSILIIGAVCLLLWIKYKFIQKENAVLTVRDELLGKRYQEMELLIEENRHLNHDIKNHILALNGLCKNGNMEAIRNYLRDMSQDFLAISEQNWTGNEMLDIILTQKKTEAEREDISFEINSVLMFKLPLSDKELVSVFGNLLDNAIEACQSMKKGKRFIKIQIEQKYHLINICIENSIERVPVIKNGEIESTKTDGKAHGYGLKNVKRVVDKYEGAILLQADEEKFKASISFFL